MEKIKIVIEQHPDGFVAYPLGLKGVVLGQGDTSDEAYQDVISAIKFHIETFGSQVFDEGPPVIDAFLKEAEIT